MMTEWETPVYGESIFSAAAIPGLAGQAGAWTVLAAVVSVAIVGLIAVRIFAKARRARSHPNG